MELGAWYFKPLRQSWAIPGNTNDREVIKRAVEGCDAVLTVLVPWGVKQ